MLAASVNAATDPDDSGVYEIADQRELFLDELLTEELRGAALKMHEPVRRENVLHFNQPWEGATSWCATVIRDGERYRMWYRATTDGISYTAYAESEDGKTWKRPALRIAEFDGSSQNNICIDDPDVTNVIVFKDARPGVPEDQTYKAVGRSTAAANLATAGIFGMVSPDGIHWRRAQLEPLILAPKNDPQFDNPPCAFWDAKHARYVLYTRGWYPDGEDHRIRAIRMTTSEDFIHWAPLEYIDIGEHPWREELYTTSAHPYYRAPYYLMFPKRFVPERTFMPHWEHPGQSDVVLMASRDGKKWTRLFRDAFLRPGLDPKNWHERAVFISPNVVKTGDGEMSLYSVQNYRTDNVHIRRLTLREDGFVSVNAPFGGGELITKPLRFRGNRLEINYSTSAVGFVRVEILDAQGKSVENYGAEDCEEIFGDEISRVVTWQGGTDVSAFAGRPIRLRFVMKDADLYSYRFFRE